MRLLWCLALLVACGDKDGDTEEPIDLDGDGYTSDVDCDDLDGGVRPGASERCDGVDNDCDGEIDEDVVDPTLGYADADGDGFGDEDVRMEMCEGVTEGVVADDTDCDDTNANNNPASVEVCGDEQDNDCDGDVDEDGDGAATFYRDSDGDGFGDPDREKFWCEAPDGYVDDATDCDDGEEGVYPGAEEICDEVDNDCDEEVDEDGQEWFLDEDGDLEGGASVGVASCDGDDGWVATSTDCDDTNAYVNTGAFELCDGVDNDCDAEVDEEADACACENVLREGQPYLFCAGPETANLADSTCGGMGLQLVEIQDAEENAWLAEQAASFGLEKWWMGYYDSDDDGTWTWGSEIETTFEGWAEGEPEDAARYYCAYAVSETASWAATLCATELAYVCEGQ